MPVEYDEQKALFRVVMVGHIDVAHVMALLRELLMHPRFRSGAPAVWDARNADISGLKFDDFRKVRDFQASNAEVRGRARIAMVSANELTFGLGRMFQQVADLANLEINVFRDMKEAEAWVLAARPD